MKMIGAEANAAFPQGRARTLRQRLDVVGDFRAVEHAERFGDLEGDAARETLEPFGFFEIRQRSEQFLYMLRQPEIEAALNGCKPRPGQLIVCENARRRFQHMRASCYFGHWLAEPADDSVIGEDEGFVDRLMDAPRAAFDLACKSLLRGGVQRFCGFADRMRIGRE